MTGEFLILMFWGGLLFVLAKAPKEFVMTDNYYAVAGTAFADLVIFLAGFITASSIGQPLFIL